MPSREIVYLDSCVYIDYLQGDNQARLRDIEPIIDHAKRGDVTVIASTMVISEVVRCNGDQPLSTADENKIRKFFQNDYLEVRPVDRSIAEESRKLVRDSLGAGRRKIQVIDAIHLATAVRYGATKVYTYDAAHMIPQNGLIGTPPLTIMQPDGASGTLWQS